MPTGKVIRKNPDGSIVVQMAGGGTRVITAEQLKKPAAKQPGDISVLDPNYAKEKSSASRATATDYMLDQLPTAVGTGFSMAGGSKATPVGLGLAALGGAAGESARELLGRMLYTDPARLRELPGHTEPGKNTISALDTLKQSGADIGTAALEQGGGELAGRGINAAGAKLAEKIGLTGAAKTAADAAAGTGVQKTPGEVSGNRAQQFLEHFLNYMPGSMGPMGRFEAKRAGQATEIITKELDSIASKNLTREQSGEAVSKVIDHMQDVAKDEANMAYNPLKKPLGLPSNASRDQIEAAARKAATARPSGILDASGRPVMTPGDGGKALAALKAADTAYGASQEEIQRKIVERIAGDNRSEAVHQYIAKSSLADIRAILPKLAPETRQAVGRNVLEDALNVGRDPVSGEFSAKGALKALDAIDKDGPKTALLFGKNAATVRASLKEIASIQKGHTPGGGMAGHRVLVTLIGALAGAGLLTGHGMESLIGVGGEMGASRALAEVVTNPETSLKVLTALRRTAAGAVRVGAPAMVDFLRQDSLQEPMTMQEMKQASPLAAIQ